MSGYAVCALCMDECVRDTGGWTVLARCMWICARVYGALGGGSGAAVERMLCSHLMPHCRRPPHKGMNGLVCDRPFIPFPRRPPPPDSINILSPKKVCPPVCRGAAGPHRRHVRGALLYTTILEARHASLCSQQHGYATDQLTCVRPESLRADAARFGTRGPPTYRRTNFFRRQIL